MALDASGKNNHWVAQNYTPSGGDYDGVLSGIKASPVNTSNSYPHPFELFDFNCQTGMTIDGGTQGAWDPDNMDKRYVFHTPIQANSVRFFYANNATGGGIGVSVNGTKTELPHTNANSNPYYQMLSNEISVPEGEIRSIGLFNTNASSAGTAQLFGIQVASDLLVGNGGYSGDSVKDCPMANYTVKTTGAEKGGLQDTATSTALSWSGVLGTGYVYQRADVSYLYTGGDSSPYKERR